MLDRSSTVDDLIPTLANPAVWLTGLLSNFEAHGYDPQTSVIRFGLTGNGIHPNYIIQEPTRPGGILLIGDSLQFHITEYPHRTFNGRNHREMVELDDLEWPDDHWSSHAISFAEAKALLPTLF